MSDKPGVIEATEANFEKEVIERSRQVPVVVDFWAPWCGPCRQLAPILEGAVESRNGAVALAKVNTDEEQALAIRFRIEALPTVVAFRDGKPVDEFMGLLPQRQLEEFLDRLSPSEAELQARAAEQAEATNPEQAEKIYRTVLDNKPNLEDALLGLARVVSARGQDEEALELLERAGTGGKLGSEVEKLRGLIALRQKARGLPDEKTLRARAAAEPKNAQTLYELGTVLAAAGKYEEGLETLLRAAELDRKLAQGPVRETMVQIFHAIGNRSELADRSRDRLTSLLY